MTNPPDSIIQLINGDYPDFFEVEYLHTKIVLNQNHFYGFYLYRGRVKSVSPLIMKSDQYEYQAELEDELGSITLHSPRFSDERSIYQELAVAHNNESIIELMVFISPFPDIDKSGVILNPSQAIITIWPIQLRELKSISEDAQFTHTNFGWDIAFRRETLSYPDEDGFFYLHKMLSKPSEGYTSQELFIYRKGVPNINIDLAKFRDYIFNDNAKDAEIEQYLKSIPLDRRDVVKIYNRKILKLVNENDNLNPDVDSELINDNKVDIQHYKEAVFYELDIKDAKGNSATSIIKVSANYVGKATRRALEQIQNQQPLLHKLLKKRIQTGAYCVYTDDLDHPIQWLT